MSAVIDHLNRVIPLERFRELLGALEVERSNLSEDYWLRFAAQAAVFTPGDPGELAERIRSNARFLRDETPWYGILGSGLRFVIAAALVDLDEDPRFFLGEHRRLSKLFKEHGFRHGALHETLAILILHLDAGQHLDAGRRQVDLFALGRMRAIYDAMKEYHWWLTGPDDLPACAALTGLSTTDAEELAFDIERLYQGLHNRGLARGDRLQTAANILPLAHCDVEDLLKRYDALIDGLTQQGEEVEREHYSALALLSFLDHDAKRVLDTFEAVLKEIEFTELIAPDPSNFGLAAELTALDLGRYDRELNPPADADAAQAMLARLTAIRQSSLVLVGEAESAWVAPAELPSESGWPM